MGNILNTLYAVLKLTIITLLQVVILVVYAILLFILPKNIIYRLVKLWSVIMVKMMGGKLNISGNLPDYYQKNTLVIANHITWLDIPLLLQICYINFVASKELRNWFFIGRMFAQIDTIFIDRRNKKDLIKANKQVAEALLNGGCLGFFPEGGTTLGDKVHEFKPSMFETSKIANSTIIPIVVTYSKNNNNVAEQVSFAHTNLFQCALNILKLNGFDVAIKVLDPFETEVFPDRYAISSHAYGQVKNAYEENLLSK